MASAAFIPSQHPLVTPGDSDADDEDNLVHLLTATELPFEESVDMVAEPWPALNPEREDWEMVVTPVTVEVTMSPVVTFDVSVLEAQQERQKKTDHAKGNPKILAHAQSSPDLRAAWTVDNEDETSSSDVFVEEEDPSSASSEMEMVSGPPSVWSINSSHNNKLSFKEVLVQQKPKPATTAKSHDRPSTTRKAPSKPTKKTTFVVVPPHSQKVASSLKRNSKSMGNLRGLDHIQEEDILGDTDAELFYSQKALGAKGRESGLRIRPDEAKRLEIIMNKKHHQRQQQQQRQAVVK